MTLKICVLFFLFGCVSSPHLFAQSLHLKALGQIEEETKILENLDYHHTFNDFNSLQLEIKSIAQGLSHLGYLENELTTLDKVNDSSYVANYLLRQRFTKAIIYYDAGFNKNILKLKIYVFTNSHLYLFILNN